MPPKKAGATKASPATSPAKKAVSKRARPENASPPAKVAKTPSQSKPSVCARPSIDEHCSFKGDVCVDAHTGEPWAVKLNQTNIGHNNNKFYIIQLIEGGNGSYACFTRWGRVGEVGQYATDIGSQAAMEKAFEKKFKDKTKNDWKLVRGNHAAFKKHDGKYDLVETDGDAPDAVASTVSASGQKPAVVKASVLPKRLQSLLQLIFDRDMFNAKMKEQNIDADRMPLGKLTESQVQRGYDALAEIEKVIKKSKRTRKDDEELEKLSSRFYTIIPHHFGRMVPPVIRSSEMVKVKYDLLDMLNDIQIAVAMDESVANAKFEENPIDRQYRQLDCNLEVVDEGSDEFKMINTYTEATQGSRRCKVRNIFRVDRPQDKTRMNKEHGKETKGRYLLWHGTNIAVVAAILKTGLRIMPHSGGRVGKGLYFASENGKSSYYTGCHGNTGVMFLVEVCMGDKIHSITLDDSSLSYASVKKMKATSIIAQGVQEPDPSKSITIKGEWGPITVPQGKPLDRAEYKDSYFSQSEYLVYEESRARIKYMIEMDFS